MPDREVIEDFKLFVNSLGDEPSIVASEGGSIEDVSSGASGDGFGELKDSEDQFPDEDLNLEDRFNGETVEDDTDDFAPDLGGFDFSEDDNPFGDLGDLGDFSLDEESDDIEPQDSGNEALDELSAESFDDAAGETFDDATEESFDDVAEETFDDATVESFDEVAEETFDDATVESFDDVAEETIDDLPVESFDEVTEETLEGSDEATFEDLKEEASFDDAGLEESGDEPDSILPETMGDLFEDGSEEAIPDFIPSESTDDELSFDDFAIDVPDSEGEEIADVEELLPIDDLETPEEETQTIDEFEVSDDEEISLGDDFDIDSDEFGDFDLEEEPKPGEELDLSPGDFGDSSDLEDYSFGDELAAIDEMKEESVVDDSFQLTDEQFLDLKRTLGILPRNLKLAVEEIIAEGKLKGAKQEQLIMLLVDGASPKDIVDFILKKLNRKIKLPSGYMKRSGLSFEKRKSGFAYLFSHHTWPKLKWVLFGIIGAWIIFLLSFFFIYRPVRAGQLYKRGYDNVYIDRYDQANAYFEEAWDGWFLGDFWVNGWQDKNWFYKYADAYRDRRQFIEAAKKYNELIQFYPGDIKGLMEYADMEIFDTARYDHAEELLKRVLAVKVNDYKAMLLLGDNYFEWSYEDPSKLEEARFVYATILDDYGGYQEILFRMLRYFLRRDDEENVMRLKETFQAKRKINVSPEYFSKVYSELGGYILDKGMPAEALTILLRAEGKYDEIPDVHYQLARYFRHNEDDKMEELALRKVLFYLDKQTPLKKDKIFMKLDTHRRRGELKYRKELYLDAENEYRQGIALYENSIKRNLIGASATGGKLYADLGDLYYNNMDYLAALNMYDKAEVNRYITSEIEYHRGFSNFVTENYERALLEFYNAEQGLPGNRNVLFALGNTMLKRENYYGAQSSFTRVINILKEEEKNIGFLMIDEKAKHRALVEMYSRAYNNLGVSYYHLAKSSADVDKITYAMVCFSKSSDYSDLFTRDRESLMRSDAPEVFNSTAEYDERESNNILDKNGYKVEADYSIPLHIDDILF